jgi:hypothetical protein
VLLADRVAATVAQEHRDLPGAQRVLHAEHHRDAEPAEAVRRDETDGEAAPREQPAGQRVGLEAQLVGGGEHALAGLRAQLAAAVERLGRGADGYLGEGGHVGDGGRPSGYGHGLSFSGGLLGALCRSPGGGCCSEDNGRRCPGNQQSVSGAANAHH